MQEYTIKKILRFQKLVAITIIFVILATIVVFLDFIFYTKKKTNVVIKRNFSTINFRKNQFSSLSNKTIITKLIGKKDKFVINSKQVKTQLNNNNVLIDSTIVTSNIRNKIYKGNTNLIKTYEKQGKFEIPNEIFLKNGTKNYIYAKEIYGTFDGKIRSKLPIKINDDDLFLSGDNIFIDTENNYFLITKNSHIINTKIINNNEKQENNQTKIYDLRSQKIEFFGNQQFANLTNNVVFKIEQDTIKSQFAKIFLNSDLSLKDVFLKKKVKILQKNVIITANSAYFDSNLNIVILYDNVILNTNNIKSQTNFYVYNTLTKTGISFNKNTFIKYKERQDVYKVLYKLAEQLDDQKKEHIVLQIKQNQKNSKHYKSFLKKEDNAYVNRKERIKIQIS